MRSTRAFLIICDHPDRLALLSGVLHRVFPHAFVEACRDSAASMAALRSHKLDAIVACFTADLTPVALTQSLRAATVVPLLAVAELKDREALLAAGATAFLEDSRWLLVGRMVAEMIGAAPGDA